MPVEVVGVGRRRRTTATGDELLAVAVRTHIELQEGLANLVAAVLQVAQSDDVNVQEHLLEDGGDVSTGRQHLLHLCIAAVHYNHVLHTKGNSLTQTPFEKELEGNQYLAHPAIAVNSIELLPLRYRNLCGVGVVQEWYVN